MTTETWTDQGLAARVLLFTSVNDENHRQLNKWGHQTLTAAEWLVVLAEEFGELSKEICETINGPSPTFAQRSAIYAEAIQVATLALKIAEMGGRPEGT